jgi:hypothetical protein
MADNGSGTPAIDAPMGPGIEWEPGEEDYPFPARAGESALEYLRRWVESAPYGRIEHGGARFIHEEDVANLFNYVTADVELLRARLDEFGDRVLVAADHGATVRRIEAAIDDLQAALAVLRPPTSR